MTEKSLVIRNMVNLYNDKPFEILDSFLNVYLAVEKLQKLARVYRKVSLYEIIGGHFFFIMGYEDGKLVASNVE